MESIIDKLRKIKKLADEGFVGEAAAAKAMLSKLLDKYNLTIDDLSDTTIKPRLFFAKGAHDKRVFLYCCAKVLGHERGIEAAYDRRKPYNVYIDATDYEFVELSNLYAFHKANFKKEFDKALEEFYAAYRYTHDLYPSDVEETTGDIDEETVKRILAYIGGMGKVQYLKQLHD